MCVCLCALNGVKLDIVGSIWSISHKNTPQGQSKTSKLNHFPNSAMKLNTLSRYTRQRIIDRYRNIFGVQTNATLRKNRCDLITVINQGAKKLRALLFYYDLNPPFEISLEDT